MRASILLLSVLLAAGSAVALAPGASANCTSCHVPDVQCTITIGSGAVWSQCDVDGSPVTIETCDTCAVLFQETCHVGMDENACDGVSPQPPPCACIPA